MSTQQVVTTILGQTVVGTVVDREPTADYGTGPRDDLIVDVDGSRYRVEEDDLHADL
ncbi:hypothetical protein HZS55_15940 [Halosimplex rubrum]|uniref:Uncharacterized protein n=1 Tax=Halosimplex rubrum TaxID=869889 RepID=A0A7D5T187_9EURY|nr:hypothetical protein [Halosimplex rubrum]QLH78688.1 hypothetical protein HZS55_15940 [Halosimplex rubrum]